MTDNRWRCDKGGCHCGGGSYEINTGEICFCRQKGVLSSQVAGCFCNIL